VSFLHHWALVHFIEAATFLKRTDDVKHYTAMAETVRATCERELWDGDWYIRGFTRKGIKIGSKENAEGKIFLESNSLAVLSDAVSPERGNKAVDAIYRHLFSKEHGIHLVWPSFTTPDDDIGYVTRVYRGIKENGAIFSHPNPWAWVAACKLGRGTTAMEFHDALLPYNHNDDVEVREAEPYSYVQFVMGRDHTAHGRGRHPWLTGSGGWAYYAATHWMLGIRPGYDALTIDPCIPATWPGFEVTRTWRGAAYHIVVKNPSGVEKGVASMTLNGKTVRCGVPAQPAGTTNSIEVVMGR
jgi:N,N'-diacetylchitobiose phosphorylase